MGHSIHLQLTLSSTYAEWSKVSRLGRKVACQTAKRRGKTLAALSRDWLRARSTHSVILQKTTQRMHACLKGFSMLLAHIVAYLCCWKLSFFLQKTVHNAWAHGHASRDILILSEDTAFLMEVLYRGNFVHLEASAASWFISPHWRTFFNNPIKRSFHRVLHELTGLGNTVSKTG